MYDEMISVSLRMEGTQVVTRRVNLQVELRSLQVKNIQRDHGTDEISIHDNYYYF